MNGFLALASSKLIDLSLSVEAIIWCPFLISLMSFLITGIAKIAPLVAAITFSF
jgi:hypothetical protein